MKYTQIPADTFKQLQLNAGILVEKFTPSTGEIGTAENTVVQAAQTTGKSLSHIVPRNDVSTSDFKDIWWIGDYSDKNEDEKDGKTKAGFIAIHMMNTLSTGGFSTQSSNRAKGTFEFEFTAHYSIDVQDKVPFEIYIKSGADDKNISEQSASENTSTAGIIGATSGGVSFTATPTYTDYGEDIDNAPVNVKELKRLDSWEVTMSGTFITVNAELVKRLIGAGDISDGTAEPASASNEAPAEETPAEE